MEPHPVGLTPRKTKGNTESDTGACDVLVARRKTEPATAQGTRESSCRCVTLPPRIVSTVRFFLMALRAQGGARQIQPCSQGVSVCYVSGSKAPWDAQRMEHTPVAANDGSRVQKRTLSQTYISANLVFPRYTAQVEPLTRTATLSSNDVPAVVPVTLTTSIAPPRTSTDSGPTTCGYRHVWAGIYICPCSSAMKPDRQWQKR